MLGMACVPAQHAHSIMSLRPAKPARRRPNLAIGLALCLALLPSSGVATDCRAHQTGARDACVGGCGGVGGQIRGTARTARTAHAEPPLLRPLHPQFRGLRRDAQGSVGSGALPGVNPFHPGALVGTCRPLGPRAGGRTPCLARGKEWGWASFHLSGAGALRASGRVHEKMGAPASMPLQPTPPHPVHAHRSGPLKGLPRCS
jgi:hypothetical protein